MAEVNKRDTPDEWSGAQDMLFVRMCRFMVENPAMFQHPGAAPVPPEHWACTAHNASWHAADLMETSAGVALVIVDPESGDELARESDGVLQ